MSKDKTSNAILIDAEDLDSLKRYQVGNQVKKHSASLCKMALIFDENPDFESAFEDTFGDSGYSFEKPEQYLEKMLEILHKQKNEEDSGGWQFRTRERQGVLKLQCSHDRYAKSAQAYFKQDSLSVPKLAKQLVSAGAFASIASASSSLRRDLSEKKFVGYKLRAGTRTSWIIPSYQFDEQTWRLLPGIKSVCDIFGDNGLSVHLFLTRQCFQLEGGTPLEELRKGNVAGVLEAGKVACDYPV